MIEIKNKHLYAKPHIEIIESVVHYLGYFFSGYTIKCYLQKLCRQRQIETFAYQISFQTYSRNEVWCWDDKFI